MSRRAHQTDSIAVNASVTNGNSKQFWFNISLSLSQEISKKKTKKKKQK